MLAAARFVLPLIGLVTVRDLLYALLLDIAESLVQDVQELRGFLLHIDTVEGGHDARHLVLREAVGFIGLHFCQKLFALVGFLSAILATFVAIRYRLVDDSEFVRVLDNIDHCAIAVSLLLFDRSETLWVIALLCLLRSCGV